MQAFLSHSRKDERIVNRTYKLCKRAKIEPRIAEFEEIEKGKLGAKEIRDMIWESDLFLLFLSENVVSDRDYAKTIYTQNWVNFELGCAYARKKEKENAVFVFEPFSQLAFPIPYLDYYILIDPAYDPHWESVEQLLSQERDFGEAVGSVLWYPYTRLLMAIYRLKGQPIERPSERYGIKIHHKECGLRYTFLSSPERWLCPKCRKPTNWMP